MTMIRVIFSLGYVVSWVVILPLFVAALTLSLISVALVGELADQLFGAAPSLDPATARALANRLCGTRSPRRH